MLISPETLANNSKLEINDHTTVAAVDTITTSLRNVRHCGVSLKSDASDAGYMFSAAPGATAGTIVIKSWKTDGTDPTPVAATAFSKSVTWWAAGE